MTVLKVVAVTLLLIVVVSALTMAFVAFSGMLAYILLGLLGAI